MTRNNSVDSIREGLANLFLYWYGNHMEIRRVLRSGWQRNDDSRHRGTKALPAHTLEHVWRTKWFAKGEATALVDHEMKEQFGWMLDDAESIESFVKSAASNEESLPLWERFAIIVLLDQVTRNVKRGTAAAYAYDNVALSLALALVHDDGLFEALPLQFQATICICLCHAENMQVQRLLLDCLTHISNHQEAIVAALKEIVMKHVERIELFGRFPERNRALGRPNTPREDAYLRQLGA
jgi:uncharacterized protein (DUF924 family)